MRFIVPIAAVGVLVLAVFLSYGNNEEKAQIDVPSGLAERQEEMNSRRLEKPEMIISVDKQYSAVLATSEGDITISLNSTSTPITANNFVYLARNGYYDGSVFHRVINGFMIQGGDHTGTGAGGPGYTFDDEPFEGDYKRGTVAMANAGPNTNGSQFFIMHADYPLPSAYVIFGTVVDGMDVVDKIATAEVSMSPSGELSLPVNPVVVEKVKIAEE